MKNYHKKLAWLAEESTRLANWQIVEAAAYGHDDTTKADPIVPGAAPKMKTGASKIPTAVARFQKGLGDLKDIEKAGQKEADHVAKLKAARAAKPQMPNTPDGHAQFADHVTKRAVKATQRLGQVPEKATTTKGHVTVSVMHKKAADAHSTAGHTHLDHYKKAKDAGDHETAKSLFDKAQAHFKMADRHDRFRSHHMDTALKTSSRMKMSDYGRFTDHWPANLDDSLQKFSSLPALIEHVRRIRRVVENDEKKPVARDVHKASSKAVAASEKLLRAGGGSEDDHKKHAETHHKLAMQYHELGHHKLANYHTDYGYKHVEAGMKDPGSAKEPKAPKKAPKFDPAKPVEMEANQHIALEHMEPWLISLEEGSGHELTAKAVQASREAMQSGKAEHHFDAAKHHKNAAEFYKGAKMDDLAAKHTKMAWSHFKASGKPTVEPKKPAMPLAKRPAARTSA